LHSVIEALRAQGARRLIYKPVPHIYHLGPAEEELYALHSVGGRLVRRDISAAVSPTIRPEPSPKRRHAAQRARESGVEVAEDDAIEPFMRLVEDVLRERHGVTATHTPAEMRRLADRFPDGIRLFTARAGGAMIAGTLVFETPAVAHTQYIAAAPRGRELGAIDAVLAHLIDERYPDRWFDFGISNSPDGSLNEGLTRFKEGFGARAVLYDRYALELP
jgi:lipid II:glycine glycyltransferase (peptidoglycan interpeptide bridge formation enzyme)